jgi:2-polyprenyl-3-methyl-5-hydroxy-6-metoxy-1,4-benzoquinol methylase
MKQWYELLFENYGIQYDKENFTHGTTGDCNFFEKEIFFKKNLKIIDIACGTGRHSIELAKRGYNLTGIDLSAALINRAKEKAAEQNVKVDFSTGDARNLPFENEFDLAIMICEGAFPLMETDEMNFQILQCAFKALKPDGKLIFTTLNGLFPLFHSVKDFLDSHSEKENAVYEKNRFDLMEFRNYSVTSFVDDSGVEKEIECSERFYVPSEITWLLKSIGFKTINISGAKLGAFSREDKLTTEDFEMLVIAEK